MKKRKAASKRNYLLALLSGLLLILTFPGAFGFGFCAWFALVPLLVAASEETPGRAAFLGLLCGFLHYTFLIYWVVIALCRYGGLSVWISVPALLLLSLYLSLYFAVFAAFLSWAGSRVPVLWFAPTLWVALDFLKSKLFSGFPWQDLAYSQYSHPLLIQAADLFGHYGITFLIVLANAALFCLYEMYRARRSIAIPLAMKPFVAAGIVFLFVFSYSLMRYKQMEGLCEQTDTVSVAVVQGNIEQNKKWVRSFQQQTVDEYIGLSEKAIHSQKIDLLIWPETAMPFYPLESRFLPRVVEHLVKKYQVSLLTGAPHREKNKESGAADFFNSSFMIAPAGYISGRYDKQHLVPFGEYIPMRSVLPFLAPVVETMGDFTPGQPRLPLADNNSTAVGVLICFESIFPELARAHTMEGANLLVNITNDAWYGRSSAPWQHLSMAVFRAVENRKSLARAANTGISALIDPLGRLRKSSPLFEPYYLVLDLPLIKGPTFFSSFGHYFAAACLAASLAFLVVARRKKSKADHRGN